MTEKKGQNSQSTEVRSGRLDIIKQKLDLHPFIPSPLLDNSIAQTIHGLRSIGKDGPRLEYKRVPIEVDNKTKLFVDIYLQKDPRNHITLVNIPPLPGSSDSANTTSLGIDGFRAGYNVVTVNLRGQGNDDNEEASKSIHHAGLTHDLIPVFEYLDRNGLAPVYTVGYSLGGNTLLKLLGENPEVAERYIKGAVVISSAVDLELNSRFIENSPFKNSILAILKKAASKLVKSRPEQWGTMDRLRSIRSIKEWDDEYVARLGPWGFKDADQYYKEASARPHIPNIKTPTLAIHAEDDLISSVEPLRLDEFTQNSHIITLIPKQGGHLGFIEEVNPQSDESKYWANKRILQFFLELERTKAA